MAGEMKAKQRMSFAGAKLNNLNVICANNFFIKNELDKINTVSISLKPDFVLNVEIVRKELDANKKVSIRVNDNDDTPKNEQNLLLVHNGENLNFVETKPRRLFVRRSRHEGEIVLIEEILMKFAIDIKSDLVNFSLMLLSKDITGE